MEEALAAADFAPPTVPLVANVTAAPVSDPETIRRLLVEQVTGMVRWRESVLRLKAQGVERLVEIGAGKVLTGLCQAHRSRDRGAGRRPAGAKSNRF